MLGNLPAGVQLLPVLVGALGRGFAARRSGLAFGLALAVRPAGSVEVFRINGAPKARPAQRDAKHR